MHDPTDWTIPAGRVSVDNDVKAYNDARILYSDMYAALKTAVRDGHFIYLLGWHVQIDEEMSMQPGLPDASLRDALTLASNAGALIRAMYWYDLRPRRSNNRTNLPAIQFINSLQNGTAVSDYRYLHPFGSAHQKLLVVYGAKGLVAFTGGWDIHTYRWNWIDVHSRITGPAALHLLDLFAERWLDHPDVSRLPESRRRLPTIDRESVLHMAPKAVRPLQTQVVTTYGDSRRGWIYPRYRFAPRGDFGLYRLILNGIRRAKEYIYVEDQYFFDGRMKNLPDIGDEITQRLTDEPDLALIVLTNRSNDIQKDVRQAWYRRRIFYERLRQAAPERVFILQYKQDHHPYVHSKCWIFDDEFAVIGSGNCNRRSFSYDPEVAVGIADQGPPAPGCNPFAKDLRIQLWRRHLTLLYVRDPRLRLANLVDWRLGLRCMLDPDSRLEVYIDDEGEDPYPLDKIPLGKPGTWLGDWIWRNIIDPDGS